MNRYVCLHGHFYQPPRENPWLGEIEQQPSAFPFHDWNERIASECYAPNTHSPVMNIHSKIIDVVNNYHYMSFNFGPTLLSWMERHQPYVYRLIIDADQYSRQRYGGHGSALAQAYGHLIMPLASGRDKRTQVIWGIRDFEHRFGRRPEGMWLPETAVDTASLEILAGEGIAFTVLSPFQAGRVRQIGEEKWTDVRGGRIDPRKSYICRLPSGKTLALFFYHGSLSHEVAFGGLLNNGEGLAAKIRSSFSSQTAQKELVHLAADGETFGHHHRLGDMALAYCFYVLEQDPSVKIINYGEFLSLAPPASEVEIIENSSWSCAHGVERWRDDCGCGKESHPDWDQKWRKGLRNALDELRDRLDELYCAHMRPITADPWCVRDDYIDLIFDRSEEFRESFISRNAGNEISPTKRMKILKLLEMQRYRMMMFTSCGWFFDDVSRIESIQVLQYAARAIQLAKEVFGRSFETPFLRSLKQAASNEPQWKNAAHIYRKAVKPKMVYSFESEIIFTGSLAGKTAVLSRYLCVAVRCQIRRAAGTARLWMRRLLALYRRYALNKYIHQCLQAEAPDLDKLAGYFAQASRHAVRLELSVIAFLSSQRIREFMFRLREESDNLELMEYIGSFIAIVKRNKVQPDLWHAQGIYFVIGKDKRKTMQAKSQHGDFRAKSWLEQFSRLNEHLQVD